MSVVSTAQISSCHLWAEFNVVQLGLSPQTRGYRLFVARFYSFFFFFICGRRVSLMVQPLIASILLLYSMAGWHQVELMKMQALTISLPFSAETGVNRYRRGYHCAQPASPTSFFLLYFTETFTGGKKKAFMDVLQGGWDGGLFLFLARLAAVRRASRPRRRASTKSLPF